MSNTIHLEKKDLQNLLTCLSVADGKLREQQLDTVNAGNQMGVNISALDEYYGKRLQMIERNKKNLKWMLEKMEELIANGVSGDVAAVFSIREK